jgi:tetratricopeptide (TPR) repeat protein
MTGRLAVALLVVWPLAAQNRFEQFDRDLTQAAAELHIADLRAEVSRSGRVVWKRGNVHLPAPAVSAGTQQIAGFHVDWWFQPMGLRIEIPAKRLELEVSANNASLTEAPRLTDGNILRSSIALAFFTDVAALGNFDRDKPVDHALTALYSGDRTGGAKWAHTALDEFPELESAPDVTLLYLFSQLGLAETEASATAVIKAHPELPAAWFYYGQYLENSKRYREAAACFEKITQHQPPWHNWTVAAAKKELTYLKTY